MKTLIIIFGLLYAVNCLPAEMDPNDYLDDGQIDNGNYEDEDDDDNNTGYEEQVSIITKEEIFERDLGDAVLLPCVFSGSNTYVRLWRKNEVPLYQDMLKMSPRENVELLSNGTLKITNLTARDHGEYVCSALIYEEQEKNPKVTHTVNVRTPARIESLTAKDNKTVLRSGETLSLMCQTTGFPKPVISWHKGGERFAAEGENLALPNIKHHNAGQYTCMADNKIGQPNVKVINIEVDFKPMMTIDQISVSSINNESTELKCTVHAQPNAGVVWKKDGVNIVNSQRHVLSSKNKAHILIIKNLEDSDFGVYTCSATNHVGATNKNITLVKTPAAVRFRKPKPDNRELVLVWEVQSKSQITAHELQYRKKGESNWASVNPESTAKDNELYTVKYTLKGLGPGDYETRIRSSNAHGWSEYSEIKTFEGVHAKNGHNKSHKKPHRNGKDKQIESTPEPSRSTEPSQNTGEPAEHHEVVTTKNPQVGAKESSGCSSLTSAVTLLNIALVVIFLVRPPTIRI